MTTETRIGMPLAEFVAPVMLRDLLSYRACMCALITYELEHPQVVILAQGDYCSSGAPDLIGFATARWTAYQDADDQLDRPLALVPDLALTLVAARAKYDDVNAKVERYLADGVRVVWVISPRAQIVMIYTQGSNQITRLTAADTLTGGDLLPDFAAPISALLA